ncbi:hypothetical protein [Aquimarina algiphila]|uniref:hypothetical protein n=1 Tax=Aquimarina algiphila TaxID=2047982 RepID=UPI00232BF5D1|nr:hypothetical protein [Aquimarina algiphila]
MDQFVSFEKLINNFPRMLRILERSELLNFSHVFTRKNKLGEVRNILIEKNVFNEKYLNGDNDFKGLYVIYEFCKPLYVGISRKCIQRLRDHVNAETHFSSSFAFKLAKNEELKVNPEFINKETGKKYLRKEFETTGKVAKMCRRINDNMQVRIYPFNYISDEKEDEVQNAQMYLFEVYCSLKLNTPYNSFRTH